ncbi:replication initiation and membrane attachment family protein [Lacticaseibacillus jixiensis]|uniref:replication initiation and membrane attachment family protein n=1 Tax=Lacticaseibacillus jixiensis TaxID=3231926 RepID=UPI0036F25C47
MQRPQSFMAQDDYIVAQANYFSDFDQQVAIALYQPLVGPVALAMYLSLWQEAKPQPVLTDRQPQTRLLDLLNISLDQLFDARVRLEAVGLLKSYTAVDTMSRYYAYELYAPVSPQQFFADDLLGMLLYDRVGQARYQELAGQFTLKPVRRSDWQDVTHDFLQVFDLTNVLDTPPATAQAQQALQLKPAPQVTLGDNNAYDWVLLAQLLARTNLKAGQLDQYRNAIYQLAKFYGLEPTRLAPLIMRATDPMSGELHLRQLQDYAEQTYSKAGQPHYGTKHEQPAAAPAPTKTNWTPAEARMLQAATTMAPREFLEATKKAKNDRAFAAPNEVYAVRQLVARNVFPEATVNLLIQSVLSQYDSVSQALLDSFANKWINANVTTPESALLQMRQTAADKAKPKTRYANRPTRQEETPDWMKADYKAAAKPVTANEQEDIQAGLDALRKLRQKGTSEQ